MADLKNQGEFTMALNSINDSSSRFFVLSSAKTWSYSEMDARKMTPCTFSKQWIHLSRSLRCPPTSTMLYEMLRKWNLVSTIAVVRCRDRKMSFSFGTYPCAPMRSTWSIKKKAESMS
eukprot:Lithocolla_globosa_v1_NODE_5222_length_1280_cov_21.835918.p2 type:complete len:118 gc:universal NODE_5222_length_1280_cov_21.835918:261-614(+)